VFSQTVSGGWSLPLMSEIATVMAPPLSIDTKLPTNMLNSEPAQTDSDLYRPTVNSLAINPIIQRSQLTFTSFHESRRYLVNISPSSKSLALHRTSTTIITIITTGSRRR